MNAVTSLNGAVGGPAHSLELFDAHGTLLLQPSGQRGPGRPHDPRWRALPGVLNPRGVDPEVDHDPA